MTAPGNSSVTLALSLARLLSVSGARTWDEQGIATSDSSQACSSSTPEDGMCGLEICGISFDFIPLDSTLPGLPASLMNSQGKVIYSAIRQEGEFIGPQG